MSVVFSSQWELRRAFSLLPTRLLLTDRRDKTHDASTVNRTWWLIGVNKLLVTRDLQIQMHAS